MLGTVVEFMSAEVFVFLLWELEVVVVIVVVVKVPISSIGGGACVFCFFLGGSFTSSSTLNVLSIALHVVSIIPSLNKR